MDRGAWWGHRVWHSWTSNTSIMVFQYGFICTALITNANEYFVIWLLAIWIFYSINCLFKSFAHFSMGLLFLTCRNFVFAIYTPFVDYVYCKYLLKFSSFPSHSLNDVFDLQSFWVKSFIFTLWLVFFVKSLSITKSGRYPTPPQPRPGHCSSYEGRS